MMEKKLNFILSFFFTRLLSFLFFFWTIKLMINIEHKLTSQPAIHSFNIRFSFTIYKNIQCSYGHGFENKEEEEKKHQGVE